MQNKELFSNHTINFALKATVEDLIPLELKMMKISDNQNFSVSENLTQIYDVWTATHYFMI